MRVFSELGVVAKGFGKAEELGGRRCWNSDETGPGDNRAGWASFFVEVPDPTQPVRLEMDVWGKSQLSSIVIRRERDVWDRIPPRRRLRGQAMWETLVYTIPSELMAPGKKLQELGFGGGDSQVWLAGIRVVPVRK